MADDIFAKFAISDEVALPAVTAKSKTGRTKHFIPAVPLPVVLACVEGGCETALPLILAIHRHLTMTGREWTPLNIAIWTAAGNPSERKRTKILASLKEQSDLIHIRPKKTATSHYEVAYGTLWFGEDRSAEKLP